MSRGITAAWDIRSEMTENRDRPEMACPYFLLPRHYFKIYFKNIIPLSCTFISFLPPLSMEILLVKNTPPSP